MNELKDWITEKFDLHSDRAPVEEIFERIKSGAAIKGTNMSILVLAMLIASIGLNMNSTAVVIGAMLISPLMGGIMAIGYGLATYDSAYVKKSFLRLLFQVVFCVLSSTIYFWLSPISTASSELLARTEPTIWDVLIAVFGGLAGIIGLTRKEKSNVLPGVAIATALMPPLCTAGYGLASHSMKFFGGAIYLFFINCVFICLATFLVLKMIHIPAKQYVSEEVLAKQKKYLIVISLVTIIPSMYMAYQSIQNNILQVQIAAYVDKYINSSADRQTVSYFLNKEANVLEIALIGTPYTDKQITVLKDHLIEYDALQGLKLNIIQNNQKILDEHEFADLFDKQLKKENKVIAGTPQNDLEKFQKLSSLYYPSFQQIQNNQKQIQSVRGKAKILFPDIVDIDGTTFNTVDKNGKIEVQYYMIIIDVSKPISQDDAMKLKHWLEKELSMGVILNIQMKTDHPENLVSGNGVNWEL